MGGAQRPPQAAAGNAGAPMGVATRVRAGAAARNAPSDPPDPDHSANRSTMAAHACCCACGDQRGGSPQVAGEAGHLGQGLYLQPLGGTGIARLPTHARHTLPHAVLNGSRTTVLPNSYPCGGRSWQHNAGQCSVTGADCAGHRRSGDAWSQARRARPPAGVATTSADGGLGARTRRSRTARLTACGGAGGAWLLGSPPRMGPATERSHDQPRAVCFGPAPAPSPPAAALPGPSAHHPYGDGRAGRQAPPALPDRFASARRTVASGVRRAGAATGNAPAHW